MGIKKWTCALLALALACGGALASGAAQAEGGWGIQLSTLRPSAKPAATPVPEAESLSGYTGRFKLAQSSYLKSNKFAVDALCAVDGDSGTAWCEDAKGDGLGEWIELSLPDETPRMLSGFRVRNGYTKSKDIFKKNNRVEELELQVDGVKQATFELEDSMDWQSLDLDQPVAGTAFRFLIRAVYSGTRYSDTCISEIELY